MSKMRRVESKKGRSKTTKNFSSEQWSGTMLPYQEVCTCQIEIFKKLARRLAWGPCAKGHDRATSW